MVAVGAGRPGIGLICPAVIRIAGDFHVPRGPGCNAGAVHRVCLMIGLAGLATVRWHLLAK
ncbi:MAG: hypothetical protein PHW60_11520 [Kiritimatiellae bacterium]|nr:hypothetical protein [Kiritimatiellia bacterium]